MLKVVHFSLTFDQFSSHFWVSATFLLPAARACMLTDLLQVDVVIVSENWLGRGVQICWLVDKTVLLLRCELGLRIAIQRSHC